MLLRLLCLRQWRGINDNKVGSVYKEPQNAMLDLRTELKFVAFSRY
jgi:hypothetical protein